MGTNLKKLSKFQSFRAANEVMQQIPKQSDAMLLNAASVCGGSFQTQQLKIVSKRPV